MKHLIAYDDIKQDIDAIIPSASYSLKSLIGLYQDCDNQFDKLIQEKHALSQNDELSISAAVLFDAYELVEDAMNNMGILISHIGKDEQNGIEEYVSVSEFVDPAKEIIPEIISIIHTVSSQMSDFLELHKAFIYYDINSFDHNSVTEYMSVNRKVSRISQLVYQQIEKQHGLVSNEINQLIGTVTHASMVMEATETVKGKCFVSIIDNLSLIEVGKTEAEVIRKTREYFEDELDDSITVKPCSDGVYDAITSDGDIPEEWEEVDGVVVLPEEKALNERFIKLYDTTSKLRKVSAGDVHQKIEERVRRDFKSRVMKVEHDLSRDTLTIRIHPDTIIEKNKFNGVDKRVVLDIFNTLKKHEWFSNVELNEDDDGIISISMTFEPENAEGRYDLVLEELLA